MRAVSPTALVYLLLIVFLASSSSNVSNNSLMATTTVAAALTGPFALNVKVHLKADRRQEFLAVITHDARQTVATEPGALQFTLGEEEEEYTTTDTSSSNVFYFHEQYATLDDFTHHTTTPHFADWQAFCDSEPFVTPPVVNKYHLCSGPDEAAAAAAAAPVPIDRVAYCLNVELCIQPEVREEFLRVIRNNQNGSRNPTLEPHCLQYDFGESVERPNSFYFHEQYMGKEGFQAHTVAPHFVAWEAFAATEPFTKPPVVSFYTTTSSLQVGNNDNDGTSK
jgi:quinol monooxygenase YgiN